VENFEDFLWDGRKVLRRKRQRVVDDDWFKKVRSVRGVRNTVKMAETFSVQRKTFYNNLNSLINST
jgi:hypothetical protein